MTPNLVPTEPGWYVARRKKSLCCEWEPKYVKVYRGVLCIWDGRTGTNWLLNDYDFHSRIAMPGETDTETEERKEG